MKNYKIYFLGLLIGLLILDCKKDNQNNSDCKGTTVLTTSSGYDNQLKSSIEYYSKGGFISRIEMSFIDSNIDYYETYRYDLENKIIEFFRSNEGYSKYFYNENLKVKTEYYDLGMNLKGYHTFEYLDNKIVNQKNFSSVSLDTTVNYYYHNGLLDSIVTIKARIDLPSLYDKLEYKYDAKGNNIERIVYSNYESEIIKIVSRYLYTYDENSNKIKYELRDNEDNLKYGTYYRFKYDDLGNLIKTEIYDSNDNQIDFWLTEYQYCEKIKLIKPDL